MVMQGTDASVGLSACVRACVRACVYACVGVSVWDACGQLCACMFEHIRACVRVRFCAHVRASAVAKVAEARVAAASVQQGWRL